MREVQVPIVSDSTADKVLQQGADMPEAPPRTISFPGS